MDDGYGLELAIDWATSKWTAAYVTTQHGKKMGPPSCLTIADRGKEIRMMGAWVGDRFVEGYELESLANRDRQLSDKIIYLPKLVLYQSTQPRTATELVENMMEELPDHKTLDDFITAHFKAIVEACKKAIRLTQEKILFGEQELERMLQNMKIRITVPQMWTPDARRRMQKAAKRAGLGVVVLASEPQCALAYLVDKMAQVLVDKGRQLGKGDKILVADLGSGTGDFVLYRLKEDLRPNSRLESVNESSGELCGPFLVDRILYKTLKRRKRRDWVVQAGQELKVTERDFERRALVAIEKVKREFCKDDDVGIGTIRGIGGTYRSFELTKEEIHDALDQVIHKIIRRIDRHVANNKPDIIMVTGGFAKSGYLMDKVRRRYDQQQGITVVRPNDSDNDQSFPVAMGALIRYDNITVPSLPSAYGYAVLRREPFAEKLHPDAYESEEDWDDEDGSSRKVVTKSWVRASPYDAEEDVVDDRIVNIVPQGTNLVPGQIIEQKFQMEYYVPVDEPCITEEFVYLSRKFEDHERSKIIRKGEETDEFRAGVHAWATVEVPLPRKKLEKGGFEIIDVEEEKHWKLNARVLLKFSGQDMQVGYWILSPEGFEEERKESIAGRRRSWSGSRYGMRTTLISWSERVKE